MKGYRTPSWFRMKGFRDKAQDKVHPKKANRRKSKRTKTK